MDWPQATEAGLTRGLEIDRREEGRSPGSAEVVVTSLESWLLWYLNSQGQRQSLRLEQRLWCDSHLP